jgi:hypothetical protein
MSEMSEMSSEHVLEDDAGAVLLQTEEGTDRLSREDLVVGEVFVAP